MSAQQPLFSTLTAWFSPLVAPSDRAQWCHLGGRIPSARAVEAHEAAIDVFFGIWDNYGEHDELVQRVLDLGLDVIDYRWIAQCVAARGLVDSWPYCFASLAERDSESYVETELEAADDSLDADEVQDLLVSPFEPCIQRPSNSHTPYRPSRLSQVTNRFSSSSSSHQSSSPAAPHRSESPAKVVPTFSSDSKRPQPSSENLATTRSQSQHHSPSPSQPTRHLLLFPKSSASGASASPSDLKSSPISHVYRRMPVLAERMPALERRAAREQPIVDELAQLTDAASPSQESHGHSSSQVRRLGEIEAATTRCREDPDRWQERCDFGTPDDDEDDSGFFGEVLVAETELVVETRSGDGRKRAGEDSHEGERDGTRRRTSSEAEQPVPEPKIKVEEPASPPLQLFSVSPAPVEPLAPFFAALLLPDTDLPTFSIPALFSSMPQLEGLEGSARSAKLREGLRPVSNGHDGFLGTRIVKAAAIT